MQSAKLAVLAVVLLPLLAPAQQVTTPSTQKEIEQRRSAEKMGGKTMVEWMDELKNHDPSIRLRAVAMLKAYGKMAQDATPELLKALTDKDASTRVNACITLGIIGYNERDKNAVIDKITALLNDSQGIVRYQAAIALSKFGSSANFAVPRLVTLSKDPITWEIRGAACMALAAAGVTDGRGIDPMAWKALLEALNDSSFEVKYSALQGLLIMGRPALPTDVAIEKSALVAHFNDRNESVAIWAHLCAMRIETIDDIHLNAIAKHFKSSKPDARTEACKAFAIIGPGAAVKPTDKNKLNLNRTKELLNHLDDKDAVTAIWACAAVAQMGEKSALPRLRTVATSYPDPAVRLAATQSVSVLDGKKAVENQLVANNQKEMEKRKTAQEVNGKTLNDWLVDLRSTDPSIRLKAIANIKGFGEAGQIATNSLMQALREKDASTRVNACITLAAIGVTDKFKEECVSRLIPLLADMQGTVRYQAATTLAGLGPAAAGAVPRLVTLSKDPITWEIRAVACQALATTGTIPGKGIDARAWGALLDVLQDKDRHTSDPCFEVKHAALKSLLYMGKPAAQADTAHESKVLESLFGDKNAIIGTWAMLCYMRINGVSEAHLISIAKHLRSGNPEVRAEACRAFAIIGPEAKSQTNELIDRLEDKDITTLVWDIAAISLMKEAGALALPKLRTMSTGHADEGVRQAAKEAIKRLEGDTKASK
jgi:HEAT repeat protein